MRKILFLIGIMVTFAFTGCDDDISDFNIDPKNAAEVQPQYLFSYSLENLARQMVEAEYNYNVDRFWANYLTQTTYIQEASYDPINRDIGGSLFNIIYTEVLSELKDAKRILNETEVLYFADGEAEKINKLAMVTVLETYAYQYLLDNFGDIPYTEALDKTNVTPAYDEAATIYSTIADNLAAAIASMDLTKAGFDREADLLYGGNMTNWKKFASSLLLRIGMRLSDVNSTKAATLVSTAVTAGVFDSNDDNASFAFTSYPYSNPNYNYYIIEKRKSDFIAADFFVDILNNYNDPRRAFYFDDNIEDDNENVIYVGGTYGAAGNAYADFSHVNPAIIESDFPGLLMDYSAIAFYLAEAVEKGYITGNAEDHYINGITASFNYWGVPEADLTSYLAQTNVAYDSNTYKNKIGMQKYIASYYQGHEAWTEARRLDVPELATAASNGVANPKRLLYPINEKLINETNYNAAVSSIGGDELTTRIFWDVN